MQAGTHWIVCWTIETREDRWAEPESSDHYAPFDSYEEAKSFYEQARTEEDDLYSCTLCAVMESADYDPHEAFR
jgi:hypothetical protein